MEKKYQQFVCAFIIVRLIGGKSIILIRLMPKLAVADVRTYDHLLNATTHHVSSVLPNPLPYRSVLFKVWVNR